MDPQNPTQDPNAPVPGGTPDGGDNGGVSTPPPASPAPEGGDGEATPPVAPAA